MYLQFLGLLDKISFPLTCLCAYCLFVKLREAFPSVEESNNMVIILDCIKKTESILIFSIQIKPTFMIQKKVQCKETIMHFPITILSSSF